MFHENKNQSTYILVLCAKELIFSQFMTLIPKQEVPLHNGHPSIVLRFLGYEGQESLCQV